MASHLILQYSPSSPSPISLKSSPLRSKQPSLEKRNLSLTTVILPQKRVVTGTETGSPVKKIKSSDGKEFIPDVQFEGDLGTEEAKSRVSQSKKIQLSYSLVEAGRATTPPLGDFSDLLKLFPTTLEVMVMPPFLIIRVLEIPPRPWPLTIAGLPVDFTTEELEESFQRGRIGRGPRVLQDLDLHSKIDYSPDVLRRAILAFRDLKLMIRDIFWFGGFWQITVPDELDIKQLPTSIAKSPAFYQKLSEAPDPDPAALRIKPPQGTDYDDASYTDSTNALLRPGIMLSSSESQGGYSTTTSGVLVANGKGELFITAATHGFGEDGLVYHPSPKGTLIGKIVEKLPDTDISIVKLNTGLRYVNEMFGTTGVQSEGTKINGISPDYPPHLRVYDSLTMDNPYTRRSEEVVLATGARIRDLGAAKYIFHEWSIFENGELPVDGSCGSPIINAVGQIVGLFRYKKQRSNLCLAVSAMELREYEYEFCGGEQTFAYPLQAHESVSSQQSRNAS